MNTLRFFREAILDTLLIVFGLLLIPVWLPIVISNECVYSYLNGEYGEVKCLYYRDRHGDVEYLGEARGKTIRDACIRLAIKDKGFRFLYSARDKTYARHQIFDNRFRAAGFTTQFSEPIRTHNAN